MGAPRDEEMKEVITARIDAFSRGDYEAATRIAHPDVVFTRSWESREMRGRDAVIEWMEPDAFEEQRSEILDTTITGDKALVLGRLRARGAGSGIEMEVDWWAVWTFDEAGLVTRIELFPEHEEAKARESAGIAA